MSARNSGRVTVALAVGATIAGSMPVFLIGSLFVQIQLDMQLPAWVLGFAVAMYWAAAAVVSILSGRIIGRIGSRSATAVTFAGAALSLLGSALLVPNAVWLVVWAMLGGAANGLGHPASNHLMSVRVRSGRLATAFGIKQSAVPFAAFVAGLTVPVLALTVGWQWAFAAASLAVLLLLAAFLWFGPAPAGELAKRTHVRLTPPLLRYLLLLAGATTLGAAGAGAVAAFAVTAGIERGLPDAMAGILLSAGSLLGAVVRAVAGRIVDRYGAKIALPLTASLLGTAAVGAALLAVDEPWAYVAGIVLALGPGWGWTGLTHFVVSRTAGPATPAATGIVQTGSYLGSGAGPLLFGIAYSVAAGSAGGTLIWLAVAAAQLVATAIIIVLVRVVPPPVSVAAPAGARPVAASITE